MRFLLTLSFSLIALFAWAAPAAAESSGSGSYNYYEKRGNIEAMSADFDAAIKDWQRAGQVDQDPLRDCRGEFQRVQIRAATDAKAQMVSQHLTKAQAAAWYEHHESDLWIPNKCNRP